jgi:hypothetical protein
MKRFTLLALIVASVTVFSYCSASKRAAAKVPLLTYEANIQQLVTEKCTPCHIPSKGGNKMPLDNYDAVKNNIDSVIARISKMPGEKGFMPFKHAKLSDSTINVFKQWKTDGLLGK